MQFDRCPYKKGKFGQTIHTERMPCEDKGRYLSYMSKPRRAKSGRQIIIAGKMDETGSFMVSRRTNSILSFYFQNDKTNNSAVCDPMLYCFT